ncbi:hypothetical protein Tco_0693418 [Tanacetum coccineum]
MSATRQGMSSAKIDQIVAQRVTDAIEAIAIHETKIRMTHDPDNRVPQQPPFKKPDVARAYTIDANGKKAYAGNLPYCNKYKLHQFGLYTVKCSKCKRVSHMTRDCRASVAAMNQRAHEVVNLLYLLAHYLFKNAKGRKRGDQMSGGYFILGLRLITLCAYQRSVYRGTTCGSKGAGGPKSSRLIRADALRVLRSPHARREARIEDEVHELRQSIVVAPIRPLTTLLSVAHKCHTRGRPNRGLVRTSLKEKKSTILVKYLRSGNFKVLES